MKKRHWLPALIMLGGATLLLLLLPSPQRSPITVPAEATSYTDQRAWELFTDETLYGMTSLLQQEVYLLDGELSIDYWFAAGTPFWQLDNARSFAITALLLRSGGFLGESPYNWLIAETWRDNIQWQTVSCRVYVGSALAYHDRYDEHYQLVHD